MESRRFFSSHAATCALLLAERQQTMGLANIPLPALPAETVTLIVGPEGGWAEEELTQAVEGQCRAVSLGEHILRADTAAVTALSIVQSRLGRLG
jgi:16S rRNA (uracil1498-N3)-methyltransferase